jgi:transcription elongation factor Elf1
MIDVRLRFSSRARVKQIAEIPTTFCCPACGNKLTVPGSLAGGKAKPCTVVLR